MEEKKKILEFYYLGSLLWLIVEGLTASETIR